MKEEIKGFIEFRSPEFLIGSSKTIIVKITTNLHCFCENPIFNVIIAWKSEDEKTRIHRELFVQRICDLMHQRVCIHKLSRATLFSKKVCESTFVIL